MPSHTAKLRWSIFPFCGLSVAHLDPGDHQNIENVKGIVRHAHKNRSTARVGEKLGVVDWDGPTVGDVQTKRLKGPHFMQFSKLLYGHR